MSTAKCDLAFVSGRFVQSSLVPRLAKNGSSLSACDVRFYRSMLVRPEKIMDGLGIHYDDDAENDS